MNFVNLVSWPCGSVGRATVRYNVVAGSSSVKSKKRFYSAFDLLSQYSRYWYFHTSTVDINSRYLYYGVWLDKNNSKFSTLLPLPQTTNILTTIWCNFLNTERPLQLKLTARVTTRARQCECTARLSEYERAHTQATLRLCTSYYACLTILCLHCDIGDSYVIVEMLL